MPATLIDLAAAQDALARSDEGVKPLPGDDVLIANYEGFCQQESDRLWESIWRAEYEADHAKWMETQCPECVTGGEGEVCEEHICDCADECCGDCPEGGDA